MVHLMGCTLDRDIYMCIHFSLHNSTGMWVPNIPSNILGVELAVVCM